MASPTFIRVTRWFDDETKQHDVVANIAHIIAIERGPMARYTRIHMSDGDALDVVENPKQILDRLKNDALVR